MKSFLSLALASVSLCLAENVDAAPINTDVDDDQLSVSHRQSARDFQQPPFQRSPEFQRAASRFDDRLRDYDYPSDFQRMQDYRRIPEYQSMSNFQRPVQFNERAQVGSETSEEVTDLQQLEQLHQLQRQLEQLQQLQQLQRLKQQPQSFGTDAQVLAAEDQSTQQGQLTQANPQVSAESAPLYRQAQNCGPYELPLRNAPAYPQIHPNCYPQQIPCGQPPQSASQYYFPPPPQYYCPPPQQYNCPPPQYPPQQSCSGNTDSYSYTNPEFCTGYNTVGNQFAATAGRLARYILCPWSVIGCAASHCGDDDVPGISGSGDCGGGCGNGANIPPQGPYYGGFAPQYNTPYYGNYYPQQAYC